SRCRGRIIRRHWRCSARDSPRRHGGCGCAPARGAPATGPAGPAAGTGTARRRPRVTTVPGVRTMPEGDTVRRPADRLHAALADRPLVRAELRWPDLGGVDLAGRTVTGVDAYGKHLLIRLAPPGSPGSPGR